MNPSTIRCKFLLQEVKHHCFDANMKTLVFFTVYDQDIPEDQRFAKATPSGKIEIVVTNPVALAFFELGKYYYFDASAAIAQ